MKIWKYVFTLSTLLICSHAVLAQKQKVWINGASRGVLYGDSYTNNTESDTLSPGRQESGHAMVDLGVNIQPSDKILIQSMVRIRNDYGGFWGAGVTFDIRQLYIKGIIGNFLKYQLGDINYKLTPYTFQNNTGLINQNTGVITSIPLQQTQYDLFYMDDQTWRQQGAAIDFALEFASVIDEMKFDFFTSRIRPTDLGNQDDQLYSGGAIRLMQSKNLNLGVQYANLYDLEGTSGSTIQVRNPVLTASAEGNFEMFNTQWNAGLETGRSTLEWNGDNAAPSLEDYFYDVSLRASWDEQRINVTAAYRDVGPNFRSAGAQTMQVNFDRSMRAYSRYGNNQQLRQLSMLDLYRDASLYNMQISTGLANYDPRYDNATPYGRATPNRRGFNLIANYEDKQERWMLEGTGDFLSDVVGQGTSALKNYMTSSIFAELRFNKMFGWDNRKLWLSGRTGMQNTSRSGTETFEDVDLATQFTQLNLTSTIFGDFDFLGEWRQWQTDGSDLVAERNNYSEVINFNAYNINYNESMIGAGIQYSYSEKTKLSLFWQQFTWDDSLGATQNYSISTWSAFFTMNF